MLAGERTRAFLQEIRTRYADRLVVLDLPPVLLTDDVLTLAPLLDGMLLVIAEQRTRREDLQRAQTLLAGRAAARLGAESRHALGAARILNRASSGSPRCCWRCARSRRRRWMRDTLGVVINDADPYSVAIGRYFVERRAIPAAQRACTCRFPWRAT